ncbi:hypothetical protein, partial [Pseudomonas sp. S60]|uniref:hypothetical protein n=1 Tax=Pseudomonas sp. S60 TaxID=211124 RepID=UPI001F227D15
MRLHALGAGLSICIRSDESRSLDLLLWQQPISLKYATAFAFASKRAIAQATQIATSGGRAEGLRR